MRDVFLVPRMTSSLIVVIALEDEGYDVIFSKRRIIIQKFDSSEWIKIGIRDRGLYRLSTRLLNALLHDIVI